MLGSLPSSDEVRRTGTVCGWNPLSVNVAVNSVAATDSAQGVLQVCPVEVLMSAPAGSDANSTVDAAGVGVMFGISKLGSDIFEQAPRAMQEAAVTKTRRMMISVNSCGRRPHPPGDPNGDAQSVRPGAHFMPSRRRPIAVFVGCDGRQAYTLMRLCS